LEESKSIINKFKSFVSNFFFVKKKFEKILLIPKIKGEILSKISKASFGIEDDI